MILTLDRIRAVTTGADRVEKTAKGRIKFHRFTEAQEKAYKDYSADFYRKTFSTSGIRLEFVTDSKSLSMTVNATSKLSSSRRFFAHSVYADGKLVGRIERSQDDPQPDGDFSGTHTTYHYEQWFKKKSQHDGGRFMRHTNKII